jgi:alkylation response protein AidB-like acyl-CoA dehydrogenase
MTLTPDSQIASALTLAQELRNAFANRADEADRIGKLPAEDVALLRSSGYLTISVPKRFGGMGCSLRECVAAHLEVAKGSASTAIVAGMHIHMLGNGAESGRWGEDALERLCRIAVDGGLLNTAASEPALGSPSRGGFFETQAISRDAEWVINGHKTWTTGGRYLTHLLVRLTLNHQEQGAILVPMESAGISWIENWGESLSLRASDSHDVRFTDVTVPADHLIERGKREEKVPNAWFPMIMATVYLGSALAARDTVIQYALERVPTALGKPIATLPKIQRQIGEIDMQLQAAQALLLEVAGEWTGEAGSTGSFARIAAAKHLATETANQVTDQALQIAGGASLTRDLPLERYFRDTRAGLMQPPSGDTALEIIGRGALGVKA